ncbi:MAG: Crp/Fnr family transcriptional regulator [Anaerolineaceae bacterium]|nr:Crp/Fnr family transcriptional regulator [Anaerolineaceae bacterium]
MKQDSSALQKISLFAELSEKTLLQIARLAIQRSYPSGSFLIHEGDPCTGAYFILSGSVQVLRLAPGGREQIMVQLGPGQAFNTAPLFQPDGSNHASVRAITEVVVYVLRKKDFLQLLQTCPDLALVILEDFAGRLTQLTDLVEQLALHSIRGRLARFLLAQADQDQISRRWTQDDIATHLGTVRDMVGRTLRSFTDAGLIRRDRQKIILLDREGLEAESQG